MPSEENNPIDYTQSVKIEIDELVNDLEFETISEMFRKMGESAWQEYTMTAFSAAFKNEQGTDFEL